MSFFDKEMGYNSFDSIIDNTYDEYFREVSADLKSFTNTEENPIDRALSENSLDKLLFKVRYGEQAHRLGEKYHTRAMRQAATQQRDLFKERFIAINRIDGNLTIEESIPVIQSVRENLKDDFYGAILVRTDSHRSNGPNGTINPLNPIVAVALKTAIDEKEEKQRNFLDYKYSIIIYSFTRKDDERLYDLLKDVPAEGYEDDIRDTMVAVHLSEEITVQYTNPRRFGKTQMKYDEDRRDSNGNRIRNDSTSDSYMVPIQIINVSGLMYPGYGTALFRGAGARNISPFMSANIGSPGNNREWSNVCAGSLNSSTDKGKITLNHSNNTSPLNSINLGKGALKYAGKCVDMSLELLTGNRPTVETEPVRMSLVEYQAQNEGASISDYIEYIRLLNVAELPNWE